MTAHAINNGLNYLKKQVALGRYSLSCLGLDGSPKFSDGKGHLFSIFHMLFAFGNELPEMERTIFLVRVLSEESNGLWGYSPRGYYKQLGDNPFFVDADDTAFALRCLRMMGIYREAQKLMDYKVDCTIASKAGNAFITFKTSSPVRSLALKPSFADNFSIHPEVNANVYHALLDSLYDEYIEPGLAESAQHPDGYWNCYFYPGNFYGTWQFLNLLKLLKKLQEKQATLALSWLLKNQETEGGWNNADPYSTSLALRCLQLFEGHTENKDAAISCLLKKQQPDGSWQTPAMIWTFHDNDGDVWQAYDKHAVIATASCVAALKNGK